MAVAIEQKKRSTPVLARGGRRAAVQPGLFGTRPRNRLRLVLAVLLALMSLGPSSTWSRFLSRTTITSSATP